MALREVNEYRVEEKLGSGGFGAVYRDSASRFDFPAPRHKQQPQQSEQACSACAAVGAAPWLVLGDGQT